MRPERRSPRQTSKEASMGARKDGLPYVQFPKAKEAREALRGKALVIFDLYIRLIENAMAAQDYETAEKALRFLQEHMPKDEDGTTMLDSSIDKKPDKASGPVGPTVNIGFAIGGVRQPQALPAPAVTVDVENPDE
jgi:hypothetical protein